MLSRDLGHNRRDSNKLVLNNKGHKIKGRFNSLGKGPRPSSAEGGGGGGGGGVGTGGGLGLSNNGSVGDLVKKKIDKSVSGCYSDNRNSVKLLSVDNKNRRTVVPSRELKNCFVLPYVLCWRLPNLLEGIHIRPEFNNLLSSQIYCRQDNSTQFGGGGGGGVGCGGGGGSVGFVGGTNCQQIFDNDSRKISNHRRKQSGARNRGMETRYLSKEIC